MSIMTEGCKPDPQKHIPELRTHNIIASLQPERANWSFLHSGAHGRMGRGSRAGQIVGRMSLGLHNHTGGNRHKNTRWLSYAVTFDVFFHLSAASAQVYGRFGEN